MPQIQLPIFPVGVTYITNELAFEKRDNGITYFNGSMPIFTHREDDINTFRMITSQFCVCGNTKLVEISRAFSIPEITVKRAVKKYREQGPSGFYALRKVRGKSVLTDKVIQKVQSLLDEKIDIKEISNQLNLKPDTIRKAMIAGRLHKVEKKV